MHSFEAMRTNRIVQIFVVLSFLPLQSRAAAKPSVFVENQVYTVKFSQYGNSGTATVIRKGQKFFFTVPINILGASAFGQTDSKKVLAETNVATPPEWYKKNARNFNDIPALKAAVVEFCKGIEKTYDTDFFNLKLEISFLDDEYKFIADGKKEATKAQGGAFNYDVGKATVNNLLRAVVDNSANTGRLAAVFVPVPNLQVATPGIWDLVLSKPFMMAHELFHSIGVTTEGFQYRDYPPNGLMSDESAYNALKLAAPEIERKILRMDLNTLMVGEGSGFSRGLLTRIQPPVDLGQAKLEFTPTHSILKLGWPNDEYYNFPGREKMVAENVAKWVPKLRKELGCGKAVKDIMNKSEK